MKKYIVAALLLTGSSAAIAVAPGGPNCGWGNMLLEGKSGLVNHSIASIINGTSGNASFGMTFGTNGCSVDGVLTYSGEKMVWLDEIMDEFTTDVAQGSGETLDAVAVMLGIEKNDRGHFGHLLHENFTTLFPDESVTTQNVLDSMVLVMSEDQILSKYVAS